MPRRLREVLSSSFSLLWMNGEACANRLRVVLEMLLEDQGSEVGGDKRAPLAVRIKKLEESIFGVAGSDTLMHAVRIVGNVGSHEGAGVTRDQLIDAYEWLSLLLEQHYSDDEEKVERGAVAFVESSRGQTGQRSEGPRARAPDV